MKSWSDCREQMERILGDGVVSWGPTADPERQGTFWVVHNQLPEHQPAVAKMSRAGWAATHIEGRPSLERAFGKAPNGAPQTD